MLTPIGINVWMRPVTYILLLTDAIVLFSNLRVQNVFHVAPMTDQFGNGLLWCQKAMVSCMGFIH